MTGAGRPICFVVQRYGREVAGGAETLCREVAERLSGKYDLTVLTTCALDYLTWKNHYPPGESREDNVKIIRFPVVRTRRVRKFGRFSEKLYHNPHNLSSEIKWMEEQGPDTPSIFKFISGNKDVYDLFIFFTYLYATTFFGLPKVAGKSIMVPMAHPEEPLKLAIFEYLFHLPRGFIFNTPEEKNLVQKTFSCFYIPSTIAGVGIDIPDSEESSRQHTPGDSPYLFYTGRLDVQKGLNELFDFFIRYAKNHPRSGLRLLLAGEKKMGVPSHPLIEYLGYLPQELKNEKLSESLASVIPSPHESLSIAALEAWSRSIPVLANGRSEVLAGQCRRSRGGLVYGNYSEFEQAVDRLMTDSSLRKSLGVRGLQFVTREYSWDLIERKYTGFIDSVLSTLAVV